MTFPDALSLILKFEGGLVDDPIDRGGRTAYGITQRTYDAWCAVHHVAGGDVWEITPAETATIYRTEYWDRIAGDALLPMSWKLAACVFDGAVNHGVGVSARFLQRAVDASPDGIVGPRTLAATASALASLGDVAVVRDYLDRRKQLYRNIITHNPPQAKFKAGWQARLNQLAAFVAMLPVWEDS